MCVNTKLAQSADSEEVFTVCIRRCFCIPREGTEEAEEVEEGEWEVGAKAREKWTRSREASGKHRHGGCRSRRRPWAVGRDEVASDTTSR